MNFEITSIDGIKLKITLNKNSIIKDLINYLKNYFQNSNYIFRIFLNENILTEEKKIFDLILNLKNNKLIFQKILIKNEIFKELPEISIFREIQNSLSIYQENDKEIYLDYDNELFKKEELKNNDPSNLNELLDQLIKLGHEKEIALKALRNNKYNVETAASSIYEAIDQKKIKTSLSTKLKDLLNSNDQSDLLNILLRLSENLGIDVLNEEFEDLIKEEEDDDVEEEEFHNNNNQEEENEKEIKLDEINFDEEILINQPTTPIRDLMKQLNQDELNNLRELTNDNLPFSEIVQYYLMFNKNLEETISFIQNI